MRALKIESANVYAYPTIVPQRKYLWLITFDTDSLLFVLLQWKAKDNLKVRSFFSEKIHNITIVL